MTDRSAVFGLVATVGLLLAVLIAGAGASLGTYWQASSLVLVIGGSLLATLVAFPFERFRSLGPVLATALRRPRFHPQATAATLVSLAEIARRQGLLSLEPHADKLHDGFLQRAVRMVIDGHGAASIEEVLRAEMEGMDLRHTCGKGLLDSLAKSAPVFGMIGTLIGLVVMLANLNEPSKLGPGMAVALLTTLYGLVVAHAFCLPLARRLAHRSSDELLCRTIVLRGVLAIQAGDHPRLVEEKLRAYLPANQRELPLARVRIEMASQQGGLFVSPQEAGRAGSSSSPSEPGPARIAGAPAAVDISMPSPASGERLEAAA